MFDQFICRSIRGRHKLISCSQRILLPTRITSNKPENALKILKWLTGETAQTCGLWIRLGQWTVWWANDHSEPISRKHRGGDWLSLNWITRSITAPAITLKFPKPKIWDATLALYYCTIHHTTWVMNRSVRRGKAEYVRRIRHPHLVVWIWSAEIPDKLFELFERRICITFTNPQGGIRINFCWLLL